MKLKLDKDGLVVVKDGNPVYLITEDGVEKDFVMDGPQMMSDLAAANNEAGESRLKLNEATEALEKFKGIEDPAAALAAIAKVKDLDSSKLLDAGKVDELRQEMQAVFTEKYNAQTADFQNQLAARDTDLGTANDTVRQLLIKHAFGQSEYFSGPKAKTTLHPEIAANYFADSFKVEGSGKNAKIVAYTGDRVINSKEFFGQPASFDEAIGIIIDQHPLKNSILASTPGGPAAKGGEKVGTAGKIFLTTEEAENRQTWLAAEKQAADSGLQIVIQD
ncbi:MAG: DUF6651 domain-containing protein [Pseudomonadota bacterium]